MNIIYCLGTIFLYYCLLLASSFICLCIYLYSWCFGDLYPLCECYMNNALNNKFVCVVMCSVNVQCVCVCIVIICTVHSMCDCVYVVMCWFISIYSFHSRVMCLLHYVLYYYYCLFIYCNACSCTRYSSNSTHDKCVRILFLLICTVS